MLVAKVPTFEEEKISDTRSLFVMKPLEPGFGYTIGNSLRRTLLASIPGVAITSINIKNVLYEFTTVKGVVEDVSEIVLNLKEVVVSSDNDEPQIISIDAQKEGKVTAGDIKVPAGVKIYNKKHHIATVSKGGKLYIDMVVERGRGYVPADKNKDPNAEIGRIPIDSIYSPVVKVGYKVGAARMGDRTDFDKLTLDVETKPSTTPKDAMASAAGTLINLFEHIHKLNSKVESIEIKEPDIFSAETDVPEEQENAILKENIDYLELKPRGLERLKEIGINTVADLIKMNENEILEMDKLGKSTVDDVNAKLGKYGLSLKK